MDPAPEPDTWEFIQKIGHAGVAGEDEQDVGDRLAIKNGIAQRFEHSRRTETSS